MNSSSANWGRLINREVTFDAALVTVQQVDITPDLKNAHVFISVIGTPEQAKPPWRNSTPAACTLQRLLSKRVVIKYTPHLHFKLDEAIERGTRVINISRANRNSAGRSRSCSRRRCRIIASSLKSPRCMKSRQRFVVMSHVRPDGDAYGCTLAMTLCLRQLGKEVTAWNEDGMLDKFRYLPCSELITTPPETPQSFEVAIVLDNAVRNRAGKAIKAVARGADVWINIDHHISNEGYGDLSLRRPPRARGRADSVRAFSRPRSADDLRDGGQLYSPPSARIPARSSIPNTTARTYEIAADLIRAGVNVGELSQKMYESYPRRRLELLRALLNVQRFTSNDRVASFALTLETARRSARSRKIMKG